jgi:hypothetical protein
MGEIGKSVALVVFLAGLGLRGEARARTETVREGIEGAPMVIEISARDNWRAFCRDWRKRGHGGRVVEADCGIPRCEDDGFEFTCRSVGVKAIEFASDPEKGDDGSYVF